MPIKTASIFNLTPERLIALLVLGGFVLTLYTADSRWQTDAQTLRDTALIAWAISLTDILLLRGALGRGLGLRPRKVQGLLGIVFAPLLHRDIAHLVANTVPFLVLSWLLLLQDASIFYALSAVVWLAGGLGTWLLGRRAIHLGASGLIFGYIGFLLVNGYAGPTLFTVGIAAVVFVLYGPQLRGILPTAWTKGGAGKRVSWEGHLFGFASGIVAGLRPDLLSAVAANMNQLWQGLPQGV